MSFLPILLIVMVAKADVLSYSSDQLECYGQPAIGAGTKTYLHINPTEGDSEIDRLCKLSILAAKIRGGDEKILVTPAENRGLNSLPLFNSPSKDIKPQHGFVIELSPYKVVCHANRKLGVRWGGSNLEFPIDGKQSLSESFPNMDPACCNQMKQKALDQMKQQGLQDTKNLTIDLKNETMTVGQEKCVIAATQEKKPPQHKGTSP